MEMIMRQASQLSKVVVLGLFGLFDHPVDLRTEDRVTILHGPNGVGKTVILRLIHAFFNGRYEQLLETNFGEIALQLSDGRALSIKRTRGRESGEGGRYFLEIINTSTAAEPIFQWSRDRVQYRRMAEYIDSEVHVISRVAEELWTDDTTGETYTIPQLVNKFRHILPEKFKSHFLEDPDWLKEFRSAITVHLVETQRLLFPDQKFEARSRFRSHGPIRRTFESTVKSYSADLRSRIATALAQYAEHSQALDRSFPQRMLGGPRTEALETFDLKERMNSLEQRRAQLKKIGLIEDDASYPFDIDTLDNATHTQKAVMTLYVEDTESKLGVLDGLEQKVDLLLGNINRKFQRNKQLRADRTSGLVVRDKNGSRIDLDSLSSGEQHELVLIYDLLFKVKPHSLVLIDEPELSLHVTWQKAFLRELFAIIDVVDIDVLLATHSPFIVGDRVDLMVPLALDSEGDSANADAEQFRLNA
jgi:predicted ATP-binding protein involved in virulence